MANIPALTENAVKVREKFGAGVVAKEEQKKLFVNHMTKIIQILGNLIAIC